MLKLKFVSHLHLASTPPFFFRLMTGLETRKDSIIHYKEYYNIIYDTILKNNIGYFIKAIYNGKVIAGAIVVILKDKAWGVYIANDYNFRKLMPNKLLIWESIKIANKTHCKFIDFGSTQGTDKFDPQNDPLDFVKSLYAPEIIYFPGYYDIKGNFYSLFRIIESKLFPFIISKYYKLQRFFKNN